MLNHISDNVSKLILHTGNMLIYTDVTKQVNMVVTEQILEGLTTCLSLNESLPTPDNEVLKLKKAILVNQSDEDKKNLQTMIKVFINSGDINRLKEALEYTISDLGLARIDSVILAYQHKSKDNDSLLSNLLFMWNSLEEFVNRGVIGDVGISDVDTDTFISLYNAVKVKPKIHQINLTGCCVVPPELQAFCKERDIRILTHNDPADILPVEELKPLFHLKNDGTNEADDIKRLTNLEVSWVTRFQAHIKCRGILSNKGYIVCLDVK